MDIDYMRLSDELADGTLELRLERELTEGFRALAATGQPLPLPSYYATRIAEIIDTGSPVPIQKETSYHIYQAALSACQKSWETVSGKSRSDVQD